MSEEKIYKNLDEKITTLNGLPIVFDPEGKMPATYRLVLVSILERFLGKVPGDRILAFAIANKIFKANNQVTLSEKEVNLIKSAMDADTTFNSIVIGRLNDYLDQRSE